MVFARVARRVCLAERVCLGEELPYEVCWRILRGALRTELVEELARPLCATVEELDCNRRAADAQACVQQFVMDAIEFSPRLGKERKHKLLTQKIRVFGKAPAV